MKPLLVLLCAVVLSLTFSVLVWRSALTRSRALANDRLAQARQLDDLRAENLRLSASLASAHTGPSPSPRAALELARLRNEVSHLRAALGEKPRLEADHARLRQLQNSNQPPVSAVQTVPHE